MDKPYYILSVDGGGIRGVYPSHILARIQEGLGINPTKHFDFFAGTSTGSIVAAAIALGINPNRVINLYESHGPKIFSRRKSWRTKFFPGYLESLYDSTELQNSLEEILGSAKLGEIKKPLLLPATDIGNGGVHVLKSAYSNTFVRDPNVHVSKAVLASCAAPIYFDPVDMGEYLLSDGGLWANNPSLAATIDAMYRLKIEKERIRVLSLGTGHANIMYGTKPKKGWGFLTGWDKQKMVDLILSLQSSAAHNYLSLLLAPHQILRLSFNSDTDLPLDDYSAIGDWITRADREFTHRGQEIRDFLLGHREES